MLALKIIYGFLILLSLGCIALALRVKRKNIGFLFMTATIAVSDILCVILIDAKTARAARDVLLPEYIVHAWLLFGMLIMIIMIDRFRHFGISLIFSGCLCIYQTYLVVSQYFGARIFSFQKRVYFRKAWWVAADTKNTGLFLSFRSYRISTYCNMLILLIVLLVCICYSHKIFRSRYYAFFGMVLVYSFIEALTIHFLLPVWIPYILYNLMAVFCLYYVLEYADRELREWSLDSFANDMSDGLILYDRYDDLIHTNDMIRNTLDEELISGFKDRTRLDEWLTSSADNSEESGIVSYSSGDRDYYFKVSEQKLGGRSSLIGTLYIFHDTTDSVTRINTMREANEELERANRMKSDFLANMSHEIRTPMNAVIGMADIAMREKDMDMVHDHLRQIQSSGRNLLGIINDILDYSKIESGKMELIEEDYVPFSEYLDIANLLGTRSEAKGLELFVLIETKLPHILRGDSMRIRQVIINLANNAIKFTNKGLVRIHVKCEATGDGMANLSFHIIDTGIGIRKEDMDKLFVSFRQLDSRRNRNVEGTGLGLAISKRLVEAMGGQIGAESEYGKGSDFWFSVPQKLVDDTNDLTIADAADKHGFILYADELVQYIFTREMGELGLDGKALNSPDEYAPTGGRDYLFFLEDKYDDGIRALLKKHEKLTGVILIPQASDFVPDLMNLQILRRPETTMHIVNILNDRYGQARSGGIEKEFKIDFMAPDAKILAVDDNEVNLTIIEGILDPLGMHIDKAGGGREAIDKALKKDYDIILMDHMMPEIDGVDATRSIRAAGEEKRQPAIIAVSANVMEEARRLFKETGMNDFVAKPIDVKDIITAVKKWLPPEKIIETEGMESEETAEGTPVPTVSGLEGLDTDTAVKVLGSVVLYNKVVEDYYRTGYDKLSSIREDYENENWRDYTIKVHSLKSSSRQIGAMELGDMAEALEKAGNSADLDTIRSETDKALETFKRLLESLSAYYPDAEEASSKPRISPDVLNGLLDELVRACDDLNMDGMESVSNRMKDYSYDDSLKEKIDALHKAVRDIDTEKCMELISEIRGGV